MSLKNLFIRDGYASADANPDRLDNAGTNVYGGAILNRGGTLRLTNCIFLANSVRGGDGGPAENLTISIGGTGGSAFGGAIMSSNGVVHADFCIFRENNVLGGTGGRSSGAYPGRGGDATGAAIYQIGGELVINGTTFESNQAIAGAFANDTRRYGALVAVRGGAIAVERTKLRITECLFLTNSAKNASAEGGAIYANSSTIVVANTDLHRNLAMAGADIWLPNGNATARGGALFLTECVATIDTCFWSGNSARGGSMGILPYSHGTVHSYGGAIFCDGGVSIWNSAFFTNNCVGAVGEHTFGINQPGDGYGGAVYNIRSITLKNCTFDSNFAAGGNAAQNNQPPAPSTGSGGAVANAGSASIAHCTFASNTAVSFGTNAIYSPEAGGSILNQDTLNLEKTILAYSGSNNFSGPVTDRGENLSSDSTPVFSAASSRNNLDPLLGPLRYNRGRTPTMALNPGSPALNAATPSPLYRSDQRGEPRPSGSAADIGAYKVTTTPINNVLEARAIGSDICLTFFSTPMDRYEFLSSSNLISWQSFLTNTIDNLGRLQLKVPLTSEASTRYFQAHRVQP